MSISGLPKKAKNLEIYISDLPTNLEKTTGLPKLLDLTPPMAGQPPPAHYGRYAYVYSTRIKFISKNYVFKLKFNILFCFI